MLYLYNGEKIITKRVILGRKHSNMSTEINLETKLVGDITGEFYVPSY